MFSWKKTYGLKMNPENMTIITSDLKFTTYSESLLDFDGKIEYFFVLFHGDNLFRRFDYYKEQFEKVCYIKGAEAKSSMPLGGFTSEDSHFGYYVYS